MSLYINRFVSVYSRQSNINVFKRFFNLQLSEQQQFIQMTCRNFAEKELKPIAAHLDQNSIFPHDKIQQLGKMGYLGISKNFVKHDTLSLAIAVEELSRGCASTGVIVSIHNCLYVNTLDKYGTAEQKSKYLDEFTKEKIGCFALSEPNAGSNVIDMETFAIENENFWTINGIKSWVSSIHEGDAVIVFAKTDKELKHKGITAFLVDKNTPGISIGPKVNIMGTRALTSCIVKFENVKVNKSNVLGNVGEGFKLAMSQLDQARIGISAQAIGIAQESLNCAISYSLQRKAFNYPIARMPEIKIRLAEMAISIEAARLLTWKAAVEYDSGDRTSKYSSMAKVSATECANFVTDNCIDIMGGMGIAADLPAERHYRDARVTKIYGGVIDVQKSIIASELIKEYVRS